MCKYIALKVDADDIALAARTPPDIDRNGVNQIHTAAQMNATLAGAGRFVEFGEMHDEPVDHDVEDELIPLLRKNHVTVLGLELPPSINEFLSQLQSQIREGQALAAVRAKLGAEFDKILGRYDSGSHIEPSRADSESKIIAAATRNGIRVAGIDPRMDDGQWFENDRLATSHEQVVRSDYKLDALAAENAARELDQEPDGSRMAIIYGEGHLGNSGRAGIDRPIILSEGLAACGDVTRINLVQDNSVFEMKGDLVPIRPPSSIVAEDLLQDLARLRRIDNELFENWSRQQNSPPPTLRQRQPAASP